ncbi:MAG: BrxE family protein [Desulfosarcina sp.]
MATISFEHLFKLRLIVVRFGEMDHMRWWNTNGILGKYGSLALSRGFPKTHRFAQAKVAFAVAAQRCQEIYDPPNAYTLWCLPPVIEDQFQEHWHKWLDNLEEWEGFFKHIEEISGKEILDLLENNDLITPQQAEDAKKLRRSAEGRSVQVSGVSALDDGALAMLAAGFFRGDQGKLAIPYVNVNDLSTEI